MNASRLVSLALVASVVASAETPQESYERLKTDAEQLTLLGAFVERYIGECDDDNYQCAKTAADFRAQVSGKNYVMEASDETAATLRLDVRGSKATFLLTPFFAASRYAITQGTPGKLDGDGNALLPVMPIAVELEGASQADALRRRLSLQGFSVEVVFRPTGVWRLGKKSGGTVSGVKSEVLGVRIVDSRSGDAVAAWTVNSTEGRKEARK